MYNERSKGIFMFKLSFVDDTGREKLIADNMMFESECYNKIRDVLKDMNYKSPYFRCWHKSDLDATFVDFGSHTQLFKIEEYNEYPTKHKI